jgi:FkbM family methyltransferase
VPLLFRAAAGARRALGGRGTRLLYRSSMVRPLRRALNGAAPEGPRMVTVCGGANAGTRMLVDLGSEKYYWLGTHEERVQAFARSVVHAGDVIYDIGAHAGFFSLLFGRLTGPSGRVYAFEPSRANFERLRANVQANRLIQIEARHLAISDRCGETSFEEGRTSLQGRLSAAGGAGRATVQATTIDALVREGATPPSLLKIDVEGAEGAVLRGAVCTLARYRPRLLLEIHSAGAAVEVAAVLAGSYALRDLGTGRPASMPPPPGHYDAVPLR